MTFGAPAALWALAAVPVLIVLYLLRVRRREHVVSSVLLWVKSQPSWAAFRPSRRVERSLLLLLQIVAAAALAAALAQPALLGWTAGSGDVVLVLDGSMSMRARDVAPTRFDRARAEARDVLAHLGPDRRAALVLAAAHPLVLVPPTADRGRLAAALAHAQPWDVAGDVRGAIDLAAQLVPGPHGRIFVWTDAARSPVPALPNVTARILGTADENTGVVALRVLPDADTARVLVRVTNFGHAAVRAPLRVTRDGSAAYGATLALAAGETRTVVFPVSSPRGKADAGVLRAQLDVRDALPDDKTAEALLAPAPLPSVLLVGPDDPPLERLLRVAPVSRAAVTRETDPAAWRGYDVVILDRVTTGAVPPGRYLAIGTVPPNLPANPSGVVDAPDIATWDRRDPVLRFVDFGDVHVRQALRLAPDSGRVLAAGPSPLLWAYESRGMRAIVLAFGLGDSDLPQHVAFPVLVVNSLAWLGGDTGGLQAGQTLEVPAAGGDRAMVVRPDGTRIDVPARDGAFAFALPRAGVYRLTTPAGERAVSVSVGSETAGLIAPGPAAAAASQPPVQRVLARLALWPWLVLGAAAVALGEWALATRRRGGDA
ncbi:MAG TPA: VWA domain-containing protein [bacterium]|nr:VWA domain-containing protein [bacterium]